MSRYPGELAAIHLGRRTQNLARISWLTVLVMIAGVPAIGCGRSAAPTAHLQGAVTLNGGKIPDDAEAFVNFAPTAGNGAGGERAKSVSAKVNEGRYDSPHVPQGPVLVTFAISRAVGPEKKSERTGKVYREVENLVPGKYATGIQLKVEGDNPNQDFHLTD
jgi:hypothetical protein